MVQDRPSPIVGWADIPGLSTSVGAVQRLGNSIGNSGGGTALIPDRLLSGVA